MSSLGRASKRISYLCDDVAQRLLGQEFGVDGTLTRLPGYIDQNYRVSVPNGPGWVLKIFPTDAPTDRLEMHNEALLHIARAAWDLDTPVPAGTVDDKFIAWADDDAGRPHALRLLSYLPGDLLASTDPRSPRLLETLGVALAHLHHALHGFDHPAAHQKQGEWDITRTADIVSSKLDFVTDVAHHGMLERIVEQFREHFGAGLVDLLADLPSGVIHGDVNDHNVVVSAPRLEGRRVSGILDFGDLIYGPLVGDLAIAAAYGCLGTADLLGACAAVVRGYVTEHPLSAPEADVLYALIRGRLATTVAHSASHSEVDREDPYLIISEAPAWEAIEAFDRIHPRFARAVMRDAAGHHRLPKFSGRRALTPPGPNGRT